MTTKFDPQKHHRRSIRLKGYDYTQVGGYYITIVTWQRECLFGEIVNGKMVLNELGEIARHEWFKTAELRPYVELIDDELIVMPNHAHGIIWIANNETNQHLQAKTIESFGKPVSGSIPTVVRAYKAAVTHAINAIRNTRGLPVWQSNYYEHIIRDEQDYQTKRNYILNNPANWGNDTENQL